MPCYHPLQAYRSRQLTKNGKRGIVFKKSEALPLSEIQLPCGRCIGCRLERTRQWALRCVHEAQTHTRNCYITLTYDDDNLPGNCGLNKRDFQLFMKRLRKEFPGQKIRFYMCGEYGENELRPHYHACLFGISFDDLELVKEENNVQLFTSAKLQKIWGKGFVTVGEVTFQSAAYVARYVMKKIIGKQDEKILDKMTKNYERLDPETGELFEVIPEYTSMSLKPGIGHEWFKKYHKDVYPSDFCIQDGHKQQPPKYYDNLHGDLTEIKAKRKARAQQDRANQTPARLAVREKVKQAQVDQLKRNLED